MEIVANTLDDLLYKTYSQLTKLPFNNHAKRTEKNGPFSEIFGAILELRNPRARLSRSDNRGKIFSALGEILWYFTRTDNLSFIEYYILEYRGESHDQLTVYGGYGPRLFKSQDVYNQVDNVAALLSNNPNSKKAVIQLFEPRDIEYELTGKTGSIPCTCSLHFLNREGKLNMMTHMRSNDAYLGLPHDIFAFTFIQEYMATRLNLEVGIYKHSVSSLHLYQNWKTSAEEYIKEGHHPEDLYMKAMPSGDQTSAIETILKIEQIIRSGEEIEIKNYNLHPYWEQIGYLLQFFKADRYLNDLAQMEKVRNFVTDENYRYILDKRIRIKTS